MKRLLLILCLCLLPLRAFAALSANTVWETRTTGSDTNSGGWVAGSTGVDFSQQDAPQYSVTDAVTAGTTTITSATANFGTDVVGNLAYVSGGTGAVVAGWYQITGRTNATTITVDRSTGLTAGTGVTLHIGGALATINTLAAQMVANNKAFIKAGTGYTTTATITFSQTQSLPTQANPASVLAGYTTTRNDGGNATLTLSTNANLTGLEFTGAGWNIRNLTVDCANLTGSKGITSSGNYSMVRNCKVSRFTSRGIDCENNYTTILENEVTGGSSAAEEGIKGAASQGVNVIRNYVHDNACPGILVIVCNIRGNLVTNNTGATSDGIRFQYSSIVTYNTVHGNGRHGLYQNNAYQIGYDVRNNILTNNAGYGFEGNGLPAAYSYDGNVYYNNTLGARHGADDVTGINAVSPYTNVSDITLTGLPYTNAAGGDYSLNNVAGQGLAVKNKAVPTSWPGLATTTQFGDMGAVQHKLSPTWGWTVP